MTAEHQRVVCDLGLEVLQALVGGVHVSGEDAAAAHGEQSVAANKGVQGGGVEALVVFRVTVRHN